MDFYNQLHPLTKGGLLCTVIGFVFFILAFRGVDIGQVVKVSGRASQSAKWQSKVFKIIVSFILLGVLLSIIGFALPPWEHSGSPVSERIWYHTWSINFHRNADEAPLFQNAETIRFYRYPHKGENIFEAQIKDAEGHEIGSFQRLGSSLEKDDFRIIKGQCKINGEKTIAVELALLGGEEVFSGIIYDTKSVKKYTCWGKKR
jgi:hypothetical protein